MLSPVDIAVLLVAVVASLAIGLFLAYRTKPESTFLDYFLGGGRLHYLPVAVSLTVTFESSILILGYPAEVYIYGISHLLIILGYIPSLIFTTIIALPVFYEMKLTSVYEYISQRFVTGVEILRSYFVFLGVLFTVIYMAIVLLGPAYVFEALLGIPLWASIIGSALVATVYTALGGMRAVVWTDAFQFLVMVAGLLAIIIKVVLVVGGVSNMIQINRKYDRMTLFDFNPDPQIRHTFWTLIIGSFFRAFSMSFSQQTVQRLNSTSSLSNTRKVMMIFIFLHCVVHFLGDSCGIAAFAYYDYIGCDPLESGKIKNPNQIIIALISDLFTNTPGMAGLIITALISAALSTLSSGYNGLAAITSEELFRRKFQEWSDLKKITTAKCLVVFYGLISTCLALAMMFVKGSFSQIFISILGSLGAPTSGMFLVCLLYKRVSSRSVIAGGFAGLVIALWLSLGYNFSPSLASTPWLSPGSTDRCELTHPIATVIGNQTVSNDTMDHGYKVPSDEQMLHTKSTASILFNSSRYNTTSGIGQRNATNLSKPKGLDNLYAISYQYFSVVSILVTVGTALLFDLGLNVFGNHHTVKGDNIELDVDNQFLTSRCTNTSHQLTDKEEAVDLISGPRLIENVDPVCTKC